MTNDLHLEDNRFEPPDRPEVELTAMEIACAGGAFWDFLYEMGLKNLDGWKVTDLLSIDLEGDELFARVSFRKKVDMNEVLEDRVDKTADAGRED